MNNATKKVMSFNNPEKFYKVNQRAVNYHHLDQVMERIKKGDDDLAGIIGLYADLTGKNTKLAIFNELRKLWLI